jgi:cellulose synthase/poly-beta-1,6-N-acetylglucosamine synthase-like glycosyltransferase
MQVAILHLLFFLSSALIFYVYFGYPILLFLLSRTRKSSASAHSRSFQNVTLLISAYNEKSVISEKIENALALDFPRGLLEIIVVSDCSDDGTDDVVRGFADRGVKLVRQSERLGKSAGLNLGVSQASGQILVFSDANAIYQPDAIRQLVQHFEDSRIGYVVGNAKYVEQVTQEPSAKSEGLYWRLETWIKEKESNFGSVVGGDGAIYAIRRELFTPLLPTDINDFLNPLQIISQGYRGIYEPLAVCYEEAGGSFEKEFSRKVRIISRALNAIRRAPAVLLPWTQSRHWLALISHKLLRWFVPVFLIVSLLASVFLWTSTFYRIALLLQLIFYFLAAIGWALARQKTNPKIFYLPYYFCLVNLASLYGVMKFFRGSLSPTWQTVRHDLPANRQPSAQLSKRKS